MLEAKVRVEAFGSGGDKGCGLSRGWGAECFGACASVTTGGSSGVEDGMVDGSGAGAIVKLFRVWSAPMAKGLFRVAKFSDGEVGTVAICAT